MAVLILIIAIALLAATFWAYSRRRSAEPTRAALRGTPAAGRSPARPRFAGVRIRVGASACAAARALADEAFLMEDAPALPLRDCAEARCRCAFVKLADRRDGESRRWADDGIGAIVYSAEERRMMADRRERTEADGHRDTD